MNGLFQRCLQEGEPVEIIYQSDAGAISQRTITIYEIKPGYLKAYCHLRKRVRSFKTSNILSALPKKRFAKIS